MYRIFLVAVFLLTVLGCAPALKPKPTHRLAIDQHLQLGLFLPSSRWQFSKEPPAFFAQKMTEHLRREISVYVPEVKDKHLLSLAQKRLAVNEGYVFNRHSGALLMIDFSSRRERESAPALSDLQASAYGSLIALENEEGVTDLKSHIDSLAIQGGSRASRVKASYFLDGKPRFFMGIIGHKAPYRFYLYYNDPLLDPQDRIEMERIFNSLQILRVSSES